MKRWLVVWALCLVQVLAVGPHLAAQDSDAARSASARAFFEEGVKFGETGQWTEAADRFSRALALRDSQVIRFNLANVLAELGRVVEAAELLRQVERDSAADPGVRNDATQHLALLAPRIAKLTIQVEGPTQGATIFLDQHPVSEVQLGVGIPVDPREHALRSVRDGEETDAQSVKLADGETKTVTLKTVKVATPAEAAATVVPVSALTPSPVDTGDHDARRKRRLWWAIGGGVVAVAAVVVVSAIAASSGGSSPKKYEGTFNPPSIPVQVTQ